MWSRGLCKPSQIRSVARNASWIALLKLRNCSQLHHQGQDKSDGWGGLGMLDECRPSVLQGDGGNAVGDAYPLAPSGHSPCSQGESCC